MQNLIVINTSILGNDLKQTVNARDLHMFLEVGKDFSNWMKDRIEQYGFEENQDFIVYAKTGENLTGGRPAKEYAISIDMAKELSMVERNAKGKEARKYFIGCERIAKELASKPKTQLELAREQVALLERLEQIEIERDLAIATKAEIGNRREATAMNTASQAVKKANALEIQLDRSKDYATVKRMEMLHHGVKFDWRKLKATCVDMGIEPLAVFDQNYGTVKAYHRDVWQETYALTF